MNLESNSTASTFLIKLWDLVENPSTNDLICWDISGKSFHVVDQIRFAREILPLSFKHNNIASFIRQLNMYGFRKVLSTNALNLKAEREDLTFAHPYFQQGQKSLLQNIKRKSATQSQSLASFSREDVSKILNEVSSLKNQLDSMTDTLENLRVENEVLWKEVVNLRQKHARQQQVVSKLVQFFISLVNNDRNPGSLKRKLPLMIKGPNNERGLSSSVAQGFSRSDELCSPQATHVNSASATQKANPDGKCLAGNHGEPRVLYLKKNLNTEDGKSLTEKNGGPKILYLKKNLTPELPTQQMKPLTIVGLDNLPSLGLSDLLEELKPQNGNGDLAKILPKSDAQNLGSTSRELVMKYEPRITFKEFDRDEFSRSLNTSQNTLDNVYDLLSNTHPNNLEDCILFGDQLETVAETNGEHLAKKTRIGNESIGKELMHYVPPEDLNLNGSLMLEDPADNTYFSKPDGEFSPNFIQDLDMFNLSPWISPPEDDSHE